MKVFALPELIIFVLKTYANLSTKFSRTFQERLQVQETHLEEARRRMVQLELLKKVSCFALITKMVITSHNNQLKFFFP